jgi:hypothetical protein
MILAGKCPDPDSGELRSEKLPGFMDSSYFLLAFITVSNFLPIITLILEPDQTQSGK